MNSNVIEYINTMIQAKRMLSKKIINDDDYIRIENKIVEKYCLNSLSLYRLNDLINKKKD